MTDERPEGHWWTMQIDLVPGSEIVHGCIINRHTGDVHEDSESVANKREFYGGTLSSGAYPNAFTKEEYIRKYSEGEAWAHLRNRLEDKMESVVGGEPIDLDKREPYQALGLFRVEIPGAATLECRIDLPNVIKVTCTQFYTGTGTSPVVYMHGNYQFHPEAQQFVFSATATNARGKKAENVRMAIQRALDDHTTSHDTFKQAERKFVQAGIQDKRRRLLRDQAHVDTSRRELREAIQKLDELLAQ